MANNNKNPRRTIWLSETEPLSHYDIWLSKNQHLNSEGEPISDSGVLRPCDYIFKVWDCDNWYPIIGLNSTALNKINTVKNLGYTSINPNTGHTINSFSYGEFHLPLFTKPECSPSELFDAGTIGEAILEYVTEEEWKNIFEGDSFNNSFKWYFPTIIHNGDININELLEPAGFEYLGGIWADMFSNTNHYDERYLVQAKYKYQALSQLNSQFDFNLFVDAKEILHKIGDLTTDSDSDIIMQNTLFDLFKNSRSIMKGWHRLPENATIDEIVANKPCFRLGGEGVFGNRGKFLKMKDLDDPFWVVGNNYDINNHCFDWVDINDFIEFATTEKCGGILSDTHDETALSFGCQVKFAPVAHQLIDAESNMPIPEHNLSITAKQILCALDGFLDSNDSSVWDLQIASYYGIDTIRETFEREVDGNIVEVRKYTHALRNFPLEKDGSHKYPRSAWHGTIRDGIPAYVGEDHYDLEWVSDNQIVKDGTSVTAQTEGYLHYDNTNGFKWIDIPQGQLEIDMNPSVEFSNALKIDGTSVYDYYNGAYRNISSLDYWNYYTFRPSGKFDWLEFTNIVVSGKPIYINISTGVSTNTDIVAQLTLKFIDLTLVRTLESTSRYKLKNETEYLITIQFGIVKIEKVEPILVS